MSRAGIAWPIVAVLCAALGVLGGILLMALAEELD